jgi:predicted transcriptional regulator
MNKRSKFYKLSHRKRFQDILCYIAGYFIINEEVPAITEIAEFARTSKQNIAEYIDKYFARGFLIPLPNRKQKKYKINFQRLRMLSKENRDALFEVVTTGELQSEGLSKVIN